MFKKMEIPKRLQQVLSAIYDKGGRPLIVGGAVRDCLLEKPVKDYDVEVFGLPLDKLQEVLEGFGKVDAVGVSFGVFKVAGLEADFSIPRRDNKIGTGHKGFKVECDPNMSFTEAARRRDLTINSVSYDTVEHKLIDPFYGQIDLNNHVLSATDPSSFLEDPLRALRVAQFISRTGFDPDAKLKYLCTTANLRGLSGERIFMEFEKLLKGRYVKRALEFFADIGMINFFPELKVLMDCPQDPLYHPEGSVWKHTILAVEAAGEMTQDMTVLWAVLCHDFGKPHTTEKVGERIKSLGHEAACEEPIYSFLGRMKAPLSLVSAVVAIGKRHLAPAHFSIAPKARPGAYKRLARFLSQAGTDMRTLEMVARADHLGRTTDDAYKKVFPAGDHFLEHIKDFSVATRHEEDVVLGRHLISKGLKPGPKFSVILDKCRTIQYDQSIRDPEEILAQVLDGLEVK